MFKLRCSVEASPCPGKVARECFTMRGDNLIDLIALAATVSVTVLESEGVIIAEETRQIFTMKMEVETCQD